MKCKLYYNVVKNVVKKKKKKKKERKKKIKHLNLLKAQSEFAKFSIANHSAAESWGKKSIPTALTHALTPHDWQWKKSIPTALSLALTPHDWQWKKVEGGNCYAWM